MTRKSRWRCRKRHGCVRSIRPNASSSRSSTSGVAISGRVFSTRTLKPRTLKRSCSTSGGSRGAPPNRRRSNSRSAPGTGRDSLLLLARLVRPLGMPLQLVRVVVHVAQVTLGVPHGLVIEVLRSGNAVQPARRHCPCAHAVLPELDHRHEAVSARAIPLLGVRILACAEPVSYTHLTLPTNR